VQQAESDSPVSRLLDPSRARRTLPPETGRGRCKAAGASQRPPAQPRPAQRWSLERGGAPRRSRALKEARDEDSPPTTMSESLMPMPLYKALSPRFPPPADLLPFGMAGRF